MTFGQAQQFVLDLPDGYNINARKERTLDGKARVQITWGRKGDPPPPFRKFYGVEPLYSNEFEFLRELYKNRRLVNRTKDLALAEARNLVDDLADELTEKFSKDTEMLKKDMEELKRGMEEIAKLISLLSSREKAQKPKGGETKEKEAEIEREKAVPPIALSEVFSSVFDRGSRVEEVESKGIKRYVPVNPIIAMYYGLMRKAYGYTGTLEQFITECLVQLFKLYKKELALIEYG